MRKSHLFGPDPRKDDRLSSSISIKCAVTQYLPRNRLVCWHLSEQSSGQTSIWHTKDGRLAVDTLYRIGVRFLMEVGVS